MSLSGFSFELTKFVNQKMRLNGFANCSYRIGSILFISFILSASVGCNLTVHRDSAGFGDSVPSPSLPAPAEGVREADLISADDAPVAEALPEEIPVKSSDELAETESPGQAPATAALSREAVIESAQGAEEVAAPQILPEAEQAIQSTQLAGEGPADLPVSARAVGDHGGKVVVVTGKGALENALVPRAVLASLKIAGGAKLSSLPAELEEKRGENANPADLAESTAAPGDTELISALSQEDAKPDAPKEGEKEAPASPETPEEKPSGTGEDDSAGKKADDAEPSTKEGQFPYGIVLVLAVCLGIAIFQNTAGKSI